MVEIKRNEVVCSSLDVAEHFGKRHDNVIRSIDNLAKSLLKIEERQDMFKMSKRKADDGNTYRMYYMNRDCFSLLVMGFTGKKALQWKMKYIEAFNKMEHLLMEKQSPAWIDTRASGKVVRKDETDVIKELVEYAKAQGSQHADKLYVTYSRLAKNSIGIKDMETATTSQLNNLALVENIIKNQIRAGMEKHKPYKQIYQDCKSQIETFKSVAYLQG